VDEQARAAVLGWQQTVNAAWAQQQAALMPAAAGQQPPVDRGLTEHEMGIARQVFGNQLDLSQIRVTEGGFFSTETKASSLPGGLITFPAGTLSNPKPGVDFDAWLIHELTHQWQYQHGWTLLDTLDDSFDSDYDYGGVLGLEKALNERKPFDEFDLEEQAQILRHYYEISRARGDTSAYDPYVRDVQEGTTSQPPDR
jgi:hypothetical protein